MKLKDVAAPPRFEFILDDSMHFFGYCGIGGIVVSIAAFQAVDPGSIPGQCIEFVILLSQGMLTIEIKFWIYFSVKLVLENTFNSIEKCNRVSEIRQQSAAYFKFQCMRDYVHDS